MSTPIVLSARASDLTADSLEVNADASETDAAHAALMNLSKVVRAIGVDGVLRALADAGEGVVDMTTDHDAPFDLTPPEVAALRAMSAALLGIAGKVGA